MIHLLDADEQVLHAWQVIFENRACVISGADVYMAGPPAPDPPRTGVRVNGQWFAMRRLGGALGLLRRLLEDDAFDRPPDARASPDNPLPSLGDPQADTTTLHATARTLLFMQDVEEQLARLARGEALERDGPGFGPYAAALPSPVPLNLAKAMSVGGLDSPALVVGGLLHALEPAPPGVPAQEADAIVRGRRLRIAPGVAPLAGLAEGLRARAADDPRELALREMCLGIARGWRDRVSQGARDARLGIVLREFVTAGARFRIIARPGHLGVTLDVAPYIIYDRADAVAYRFDACILGTLVAVPARRSLRSSPRVLWPANYDSPFTPSDEQCPPVCTSDFFAERPVAERNSHTIIDWLLCTRHILRAGFYGGGHSLNPYRDPCRWPERRLSPQDLAATNLPIFRFQRGE